MTRYTSLKKQIRTHLGNMSRLIRFAKQQRIHGRPVQERAMITSAKQHWEQARNIYKGMSKQEQISLNPNLMTSLQKFVPLPPGPRPRLSGREVTKYIDREKLVYIVDPLLVKEVEQAQEEVKIAHQKLKKCEKSLRECLARPTEVCNEDEDLLEELRQVKMQLANEQKQFEQYKRDYDTETIEFQLRQLEKKDQEIKKFQNASERYQNAINKSEQLVLLLIDELHKQGVDTYQLLTELKEQIEEND